MYFFEDININNQTIRNIFKFVGQNSIITFPDIESNIGPERADYLAWLAEGNIPEPWNPEA